MNNRRVSVIVTAGGRGRRFGAAGPKQFMPLNGIPILARTLAVFDRLDCVSDLWVTVPDEYIALTEKEIIEAYSIRKVMGVIAGGDDRQSSVYRAIRALGATPDIVLIHDGVRPFITEQTIRAVIDGVCRGCAAIAGVKTTDTIKLTGRDGQVLDTPSRDFLWAARTPQGFSYETILQAHEQAARDGFTGTDDSMLVERLKLAPVHMVEDAPSNLKITTPEDLIIAETLLHLHRERENP